MKTFNTGREYSPEGQVIEYSTIETLVQDLYGLGNDYTYVIDFSDLTRGIKGRVSVWFVMHGKEPTQEIEAEILNQYDTNNYS